METKAPLCVEGECRHQAALKHVRKNVREISHELSQPLLVIQGYLELLELGKCSDDMASMKQILETVAGQMDTLQEIHGRLKETIQPGSMDLNETIEGRKNGTEV